MSLSEQKVICGGSNGWEEEYDTAPEMIFKLRGSSKGSSAAEDIPTVKEG